MTIKLNEVRGFMEELSPELVVTVPVSGNIVSKVGYIMIESWSKPEEEVYDDFDIDWKF